MKTVCLGGTGRVVALKNNRLLLHFVGEAKTGYTLKSLNVEASKSVVHATDLMLDIPPEKSRNSGYRMPASSQFQPSNKLNSGITLGGFYSKFKTEVDDTNEEFDNSLLNLGLSFSKLYGLFEPYISLGYEFSKREQEGLEVKTSSLSFSLGLRYNFQKFQKSQITPFISLALGYLKENNEGEEESREVGDIEIKGSGFFGSVGLGAKYFVSHQAGVLLGLWYLKSFSYELEEEGGDVDVDISGFKGLIGLFLYF